MRQWIVGAAQAAAIAAISLLGLPTWAAAGAGLWSTTYKATPSNCSIFSGPDLNNFCYSEYEGSLELGVRFTTSERVLVTGLRVYRVDPANGMSGTLWNAEGEGSALATGAFAAKTDHGWQDMEFAVPVLIEPYTNYIASYHAPDGPFAFEHYFFASSSFAAGPITALQSISPDRGNGVYCYGSTPCFPTDTNWTYNTNYWVTPLWAYAFSGFYQPVDNGGVWNKAKAGSAIPVKFSLDGYHGLSILKDGYPRVTSVACPNGATPTDVIEETTSAGSSGLTYDPSAGQYVYVWKTNKSWAGKCYSFELGLIDDTSRTFFVQFFR